ncbi:MAG: family 16 glycosylhydrolase [Intestinibacter sp.]
MLDLINKIDELIKELAKFNNGIKNLEDLLSQNNSKPENQDKLLDDAGAYVIDDFSSDKVDNSKWGYELGWVRNGETQKYVNTNAVVKDNKLELKAIKDNNGNWTSSSIISKGHFAFMYGKIEAKIKFCNKNGSFPAFWTLGDSFEFGYNENGSPSDLAEWWPYCGEFDIVEFYKNNFTSGIFYDYDKQDGRVYTNEFNTGDWHIFAMEWLEDGVLKFTIDGKQISQTKPTDNKALHIPHFILLNQALGAAGGNPDGNCTNMTTYVDWVKYYPVSTKDVKLNSEDFELVPGDFQDNHCILRLKFNDNCINKAVEWSSSDESILTVKSGLVATANRKVVGEAIITAKSFSGVSKSIKLTANKGIVELVKIK